MERAVNSDRQAAQPDASRVELGAEDRIRVACPACGSSEFRVMCSARDLDEQRRVLTQFYRRRWRRQDGATSADRTDFTHNYVTDIARCVECGLLYRNPRPAGEAIVRAYSTDQYDEAYLQAEFVSQCAWARTKIPELHRRLANQAGRRRKPRILELGSFVGGFLAEGVAQGWEMLGIDPGKDVTAFCRARGLPVVHGTLEDAELEPGSFDALVIWNTFDQLPNPHSTLAQAVRLLADGGFLVIRIPNGACFSSAVALRSTLPRVLPSVVDVMMAWNNLLTFPYLHGYSTRTLESLTAPYGFRCIASLPDTLVPTPAGHLTWAARLEERLCHGLCRAAWHLVGPTDGYALAPWLDLYFERGCADPQGHGHVTAEERLGFVPVYVPTAFRQSKLRCPSGRRRYMNDSKTPYMPNLISKLLSGGALWRADSRQWQRMDSWLPLGLARRYRLRLR